MATAAQTLATVTPRVRRRPRRRLISAITARAERWAGVLLVALVAIACVVIPVVNTNDPYALGTPLQPPSPEHLFGTDHLGRDIFIRVFHAGRVDLVLIAASVLLAAVSGVLVGLVISGMPRAIRSVFTRITDAMIAIPYLVLVLGISAAIGSERIIPGAPPGAVGVVIAMAISGWAPYASLTLTQAIVWRQRESVLAVRLLGYGPIRTTLRHVAPGILPANVSYAATNAVSTVSGLAALALLGVGVQEPLPELGQMMQTGIALLPVAWWVSIIPGITILTLGIGFGLIADSFDGRGRA